MCAHHWIGFTPSVNRDIMGWDVAGGKLEVERWQNSCREKTHTHLRVFPLRPLGSLTIKILNRNSMASVPIASKDLC